MKALSKTWCIFMSCLVQGFLVGQTMAPDMMRQLHPPVAHPIRLSGTFGELRSTHFHAGLDIKSKNGSWGDPVFTIDDGFIERVSVSAGGFGNAIYIQHPNGLTSVYAHLQAFAPELESYVLNQQLTLQTFEIDLTLNAAQFKVKKGQEIGKMGSTGYSFGPHLHFEIRNTKSNKVINPMHYGFVTTDIESPIIHAISIYSLDHRLYNYATHRINISELTDLDTIEVDAWRVGLGIESNDPHNGGRNQNGIYSSQVWIDGSPFYGFKMDSMAWEHMSCYPAHIDYHSMIRDSRKVHKCYRLPTNLMNIYDQDLYDGVIPLFRNRLQHIRMEVMDFAGNRTSTEFFLRQSSTVTSVHYPIYHKHLIAGRADTIAGTNYKFIFPAGALFEDLYCRITSEADSSAGVYSHVYCFANEDVPLKMPVQIQIKPNSVPPALETKLVVVNEGKNKMQTYSGASRQGDWLVAKATRLGRFLIVADTIPPKITLLKNASSGGIRQLFFQIEDDLSGSNLKYNAYLDDNWILAAYDLKSRKISCEISEKALIKGQHHFKLLVEDAVANKVEYVYRFSTQ